jgi:hypothetical protein
MAHIDISLGGKFKYAYGCCPGHDRFGKYSQDAKHGSKVRSRSVKLSHRMTRRIMKHRLNVLLKGELD